MKMVTGFVIALFLCATAGVSQEKTGKGAIEGVSGTVYRVNGNKHKDSKVTCHPQDVVEIDWTYPISPPFPTKATEHSSAPAVVKGTGVHRVVNVSGPIGTGEFAASFRAEKKGRAELTFTVFHGKAETVMKCLVEVK